MPIRFRELLSETKLQAEVDSLKTLHELATNWNDIRSHIRGAADIGDVLALLQAITAKNDAVIQALNSLTEIDVNTAKLERLSAFLTRLQDIDPIVQKLLSPVNKFEETGSVDLGLVDFPLLSVDSAKKANKPLEGFSLDFSLTGSAGISLEAEAGDLLPFPKAPKPGKHLRISADGSVMAGAGAKVPFSGGKLAADVAGEASAKLSYFFKVDPDSLYAFELANNLPNLANPFSYSDLITAMRDDDLEAFSLRTNATLNGNLNLSVTQPDVLWAPGIPGQVNFTFTAQVRKTGAINLVVRAERDALGNLEFARMTLARAASTDKANKVGLEITVDSSGIFKGLRDHLGELLGTYQSTLKDYEEFLEPGTWLRSKGKAWADKALTDTITNDTIRNAVALAFGADEAESRFSSSLSEALTDAANSVTGFFDERTDDVKERIKLRLAQYLPDFLIETLGARLDKLIESGVSEIQGQLKAKVDDTAKRAGKKADEQIKQLSEMGNSVQSAISNAQTKADKLLVGVRNALSTTEQRLQALHDYAAALAREKLTVSWSETVTTSEGQSVEFDASLPVDTDLDAFDRTYDLLMRGDINDIADLSDHPEVTVHHSAISAFSRWQRQRVYTVVFLQTLIAKGSILDADATIHKEGENIVIGTSGSLKKWSSSKRQKQTASFMNVIDLAATRSKADEVDRHFEFKLGLKHEENRFQENEVRNFLEQFEELGAIRNGATDRAVTAMLEAGLIGPSGIDLKSSISLGMNLNQDQFSSLIRLENPPNDEIEERVKLFKTCIPQLILSGTFDRRFSGEDRREKRIEYANQVLRLLADQVHFTGDDMIQMLVDYKSRKEMVVSRIVADVREQKTQLERGEKVVEMLEALYDLIVCLRNVWTTNPVQQKRTERWYRNQQQKIVEDLDLWMDTGFSLFAGWKNGKPQYETVAFCAILGRLAGGASNPVKMSISIETMGRPETIIIS